MANCKAYEPEKYVLNLNESHKNSDFFVLTLSGAKGTFLTVSVPQYFSPGTNVKMWFTSPVK